MNFAFFRRLLLPAAAALCFIALSTRQAKAAGNAQQPPICVRSCWGARASSTPSEMSALNRAVVHHTAGASDYNTSSQSASAAIVRSIQNYHMDAQGWSDIGYHFLVDKLGNAFEGRVNSYVTSKRPRGAHDGVNTNSFGFNIMGYYHTPHNQVPTSASRSRLYDLMAWRMPNGYSPYGGGTYGGRSGVGYLCGHRDALSTACPGDLLYAYLGTNLSGGEMRNEVNARIVGGAPPPPPATYAQETYNQPVGNNQNGTLEVFAVGKSDTAVYSSWQNGVNGPFVAWDSKGGWRRDGVAVARQPDGRQIMFSVGTDSRVYTCWQTVANGGWSGWSLVGGWVSSVAVGKNQDGRLQLFMVGTDGKVWTTAQTAANSNGAFGGWSSFNENVKPGIAVAPQADGRLQFFINGTDSKVYNWWQNSANGSTWSRGELQGSMSSIDVGRMNDGRLIIFCVGTDQKAWHKWQTAPNGGWSGWADFGENIQPGMAVAPRIGTGALQFFMVGTDSQVYMWYYDMGWHRLALGGLVKPGLSVGLNPDGRVSLFAVGLDEQIYTCWQSSLNGGFSGWAQISTIPGGCGSLTGSM